MRFTLNDGGHQGSKPQPVVGVTLYHALLAISKKTFGNIGDAFKKLQILEYLPCMSLLNVRSQTLRQANSSCCRDNNIFPNRNYLTVCGQMNQWIHANSRCRYAVRTYHNTVGTQNSHEGNHVIL